MLKIGFPLMCQVIYFRLKELDDYLEFSEQLCIVVTASWTSDKTALQKMLVAMMVFSSTVDQLICWLHS